MPPRTADPSPPRRPPDPFLISSILRLQTPAGPIASSLGKGPAPHRERTLQPPNDLAKIGVVGMTRSNWTIRYDDKQLTKS